MWRSLAANGADTILGSAPAAPSSPLTGSLTTPRHGLVPLSTLTGRLIFPTALWQFCHQSSSEADNRERYVHVELEKASLCSAEKCTSSHAPSSSPGHLETEGSSLVLGRIGASPFLMRVLRTPDSTKFHNPGDTEFQRFGHGGPEESFAVQHLAHSLQYLSDVIRLVDEPFCSSLQSILTGPVGGKATGNEYLHFRINV